ncbi:MAG: zf-HC2 domain-containing protein [Pyrinomonadaceae bacterium]|nr:zf-HC2 domain-containing protein [Pyrinomonadaceae bacterium]
MNCEQCQELISVYLDSELENKVRVEIQMHLAMCAECAKVCEDFAMILDFCDLEESEYAPPPNPKALWCRINNLIETEVAPEILKEAEIRAEQKRRRWQFSFSQVFASILGIALFSSLMTLIVIKNFSAPIDVSANTAPSLFDRALGKVGLIETPKQTRENRVKGQQAAIDYWNKRVEAKRANWNANLREGFDRNLNEINQVVFEYDQILQQNPNDDLSGEMLDSALNEKMELLREFAEL